VPQIKTSDGIGIHYEEEGRPDGVPLIFSNSLGANLHMWDGQADAAAGVGFRVIRYDQRGHGKSDAPEGEYTLERLGKDVLDLMDALKIQRAAFCGLSMGGMTGQLFGAKYPGMLRSLTLCDTTSKMPDPTVWPARIKAARGDGMAALAPSTLERWFTAPYRAKARKEIERVGAMIASTPVEGFVGCCQAIEKMDQTHLLSGIKTPTLIIVGEDDPSTTVEHSEIIHGEIVGSKLVVLKNAAHLSNIEQAADFNKALRTFLDKH